MQEDFWDKSAGLILGLAIFASLIFAAVVLGWQIYYWLRTSVWIPLPLAYAFDYIGIDLSSVYMPSSWQGLAEIAQWLLNLPMSLGVPTIGVLGALVLKTFVSANFDGSQQPH